jgi:hypothetical protein
MKATRTRNPWRSPHDCRRYKGTVAAALIAFAVVFGLARLFQGLSIPARRFIMDCFW